MKIKTIPFNAVQKAFYKLLSEGQTAPVYDRIPAGDEEMPYIWLGEFHGVPVEDNKTHTVHRISQQIDIWSNQPGKKEVNEILNDIATLVRHYQLPLEGFKQVGDAHISLYQAIGERYEDKTSAYHGIMMIEYTIEEID